MEKREFKDKIYTVLASLDKAMANRHRLEIIDLLGEAERSVEEIAEETAMSVEMPPNISKSLNNRSWSRSSGMVTLSFTALQMIMYISPGRTSGISVRAGMLYESLKTLLSFPDSVFIFPAHTNKPLEFG
jgi:hypothetical protein